MFPGPGSNYGYNLLAGRSIHLISFIFTSRFLKSVNTVLKPDLPLNHKKLKYTTMVNVRSDYIKQYIGKESIMNKMFLAIIFIVTFCVK